MVVRTQRGEGDDVRVAVRDAGIGLDPLSAERIFDAFHTTKPSGLGMGLAISRSIVEWHGGRLWATANEPNGAVFKFALPVHGAGETASQFHSGSNPNNTRALKS
jgi:signal transduction histidine kinase